MGTNAALGHKWLPTIKKTHVRDSKRGGCQRLRKRMFANSKSPRISSLFFIDFMSYGVRIEVELFAQNRPPLSLWSLIWTGWKPRFHRFFEDFKERKDALIVCAVSTAPLFFFGNCRKKDFNCLRSIGSPVFLLWKCLISGERCIFSRIVTYFKERKVSRFLFVISTASLYAAENDYVFGSTHLP